jgi:two-component system cell cycle response regulator
MPSPLIVLAIDDSPANLKLIRVLLSVEGYVVRTAADAEAALLDITMAMPDLILMDLQLPGMDGLTLSRKLKADAATRHIPIIAITSYAMKGDEDRAREAGCDGYISKPINTRTFPALIARFFENPPSGPPQRTQA